MKTSENKLQLERILFFSDAVIAIALTLLIIEIKVPHLQEHSSVELNKSLHELVPKFISFLVSFFVIAIYWVAHHHLFGFVTGFTNKLIWLNMLFLLSIVIMPFSTAFFSENFNQNAPYSIYCLNIFITGMLNYWIVRYISSKKLNISTVSDSAAWRSYHKARSLVAPLIFLLSMFLSYYSIIISRLSFILIFPIIYLINHKFKNQQNEINR